MCHSSVLNWIPQALAPDEITGKKIIEVGSYDVNGSVRPYVTSHKPAEYVGVDISEGPGVDRVMRADQLIDEFDVDSFDVVISTEMMEHVVDWQNPIVEMVEILRPGGALVITTRGPGFPYHPYPIDTWRYTVDIMHRIMSAAHMSALTIVNDPEVPGVFIKAYKPEGWVAPWRDTPLATVFADAGVIPMVQR